MPRQCTICGKGRSTGFTISHSHRKTKRSWLPNLQRIKVKKGNQTQRAYVCTRCLRAGKVKRAL